MNLRAVILLLLLGILSWVSGQNQTSSKSRKSDCLPLLSKYDKRVDQTLVQTQPFLLAGTFWVDDNAMVSRQSYRLDDWGFAIAFLYSYPGKQYSKPNEIGFEALYEGRDFRYEKKFDLWFELDNGETIHAPFGARTTEIVMTRRKREHFSTKLQVDDLGKIANAKSIHLRVNDDKFELTPCEYSTLRAFFGSIK